MLDTVCIRVSLKDRLLNTFDPKTSVLTLMVFFGFAPDLFVNQSPAFKYSVCIVILCLVVFLALRQMAEMASMYGDEYIFDDVGVSFPFSSANLKFRYAEILKIELTISSVFLYMRGATKNEQIVLPIGPGRFKDLDHLLRLKVPHAFNEKYSFKRRFKEKFFIKCMFLLFLASLFFVLCFLLAFKLSTHDLISLNLTESVLIGFVAPLFSGALSGICILSDQQQEFLRDR